MKYSAQDNLSNQEKLFKVKKCLRTKIKFSVLTGKYNLRIKMNHLLRPQKDVKVEPHRFFQTHKRPKDLKGIVPQQPHRELK